MAMSLKEKAVLGGVLTVGIYAVTALLWFTSFSRQWADMKKWHVKAQNDLARERKLVAEESEWDQAYQDEVLRIREIDKGSDTYWLGVIERLANKNYIEIPGRKTSPETVADDLNKITVELTWNGAFESLVKFLYELDTTDEGTFDVQSLSFAPNARSPGFLSGKMTLVCVFRRSAK